MPPWSSPWERLSFAATALAVAVLPERVKEHPRLQPYATTSAHAVSAYVEVVVAVAFFVKGMLVAVSGFSHGPGWEYLVRQPELTQRDFFAMGALGYLAYLLQPITWVLLYCFAEGVVRALEALVTGRHLGLGFVWLAWRAGRLFRQTLHRRRLDLLLGPPRPDEIIRLPSGRTIALEVYSVESKPWSETQVVEVDGAFFELAGRNLVRRGRWHAWRYQFLPLGENEVIRGAIIPLGRLTSEPPDSEARAFIGAGLAERPPASATPRGTPARDR